VRGELGRPFSVPIESGGLTTTPYIFAATGERIFERPTQQELDAGVASVHTTNFGAGVRFNILPWNANQPDGYAFVEYSRRRATDQTLNGDRIFTGALIRY
jgi:hypothetical protein